MICARGYACLGGLRYFLYATHYVKWGSMAGQSILDDFFWRFFLLLVTSIPFPFLIFLCFCWFFLSFFLLLVRNGFILFCFSGFPFPFFWLWFRLGFLHSSFLFHLYRFSSNFIFVTSGFSSFSFSPFNNFTISSLQTFLKCMNTQYFKILRTFIKFRIDHFPFFKYF